MRQPPTIAIAVTPCGRPVAMTEPVTICMFCSVGAVDTPNVRSSHSITQRRARMPKAVGLILAVLLIGSLSRWFTVAAVVITLWVSYFVKAPNSIDRTHDALGVKPASIAESCTQWKRRSRSAVPGSPR